MNGATSIDAEPILVDSPRKKGSYPEQRIQTRLRLEKGLGAFQMDSLINRFFSFHEGTSHFNYKAQLKPRQAPRSQVGICFVHTGQDNATFGDSQSMVTGGEGLFTFNPALEETHCFNAGMRTQVSYFEINPTYFTQLLLEQQHIPDTLKEKVLRGEFLKAPADITPVHHRIISDITHCPLEGSLGDLMLEGSLHQVIALQLASLAQPLHREETIGLRDREVIHAIKNHLCLTLQENHSLAGLSRTFGINQCKLKKYFREVFGVSVIGYLYDLKMEYARQLLYDEGKYVGEAALAVGYKNPNHFATAFKRKFGINPSKLKR